MLSQGKSQRAIATDAEPPEGAAETQSPPAPEEIRKQLERILESCEFLGSQRTRRFLSYVVDEALAGRGDRIKAFSVAIAAFDRDETFNPQTDPIVRIEAGRLRRCLERYYLKEGAAGDVLIAVPKGSYVPDFSWYEGTDQHAKPAEGSAPASTSGPQPESQSSASFSRLSTRTPAIVALMVLAFALGVFGTVVFNETFNRDRQEEGFDQRATRLSPQPTVAVLPFASSRAMPGDAELAIGMTNEVIRGLWQQSGMTVLGPRALRRLGATPDVTTVGHETSANFVLSGDIQHSQGKVQVAAQLSETAGGSVVWAETFDRDFNVGEIFDLQAEISREVVRKVVQPQGAIALFDWKRSRGLAPEAWEAYDCVVQAEELYRRGRLALERPDTGDCLRRAIEKEPGYADPWIMLALLDLDVFRYTPQTKLEPDILDNAIAAAQKGIDLAPDSGRARMAMMMALHFRGDVEQALAVGDIALRLSPQDPDVVAEVGFRQVVSGNAVTGIELLQRAADLYIDVPDGLRLAMSLGYLRRGSLTDASNALAGVASRPNFVYCAVVAAVYGKAGKRTEAEKAVRDLLRDYPDFPAWASEELARRHIAPDLAASIVEGWRVAGLKIAPFPRTSYTP